MRKPRKGSDSSHHRGISVTPMTQPAFSSRRSSPPLARRPVTVNNSITGHRQKRDTFVSVSEVPVARFLFAKRSRILFGKLPGARSSRFDDKIEVSRAGGICDSFYAPIPGILHRWPVIRIHGVKNRQISFGLVEEFLKRFLHRRLVPSSPMREFLSL